MDEVEEIKSRLDVSEVVGSYVPLKQAGRNLKAPCPFHNEKTASFMVSPDKNIWHCFGCNEGGDIFTFVEKMEGLDFRGALELLARKAGVELKASRGGGGNSKLKERLIKAHEWAVKYYQATLVRNPDALDYAVKRRRLTRETIRTFGIGYAPDNWEGLAKFLQKKGFTESELLQAGLVAKKRGLYDLFRGRLMLAIHDAQGQPVGFTGRVLEEDAVPKYLNTPQTPIYDKSRIIYGFHLAKEAIRQADAAVLVEGNMDVVASHQAGVKNVVAVSGTALTMDQLKVLGRLTKNIKLAFDQDTAGLRATIRAIELAQKLGLTLSVVAIEGAKDPDELIQRDPSAWQQAITDAPYVVDYLFSRYEREYDLASAIGKRGFSDQLAYTLKRLADPVEQDHYVRLLAEKTGTSADKVREKVEAASDSGAPLPHARAAVQTKPQRRAGVVVIEESLLGLALAYPAARVALDDANAEDFADERCQRIFQAARDDHTTPAVELAARLQDDADYVKILALRGEEEYGSLAPADRSFEAFQLVRRLQTLRNRSTKEQIAVDLRQAEAAGDSSRVRTLLERYQALIKEEGAG